MRQVTDKSRTLLLPIIILYQAQVRLSIKKGCSAEVRGSNRHVLVVIKLVHLK